MPLWLKLFLVFIVLAAIAFGLTLLPVWIWHPLGLCQGTHVVVQGCKGYNFWSGIFSDIGEVSLIGAAFTLIAGLYHQHNCHVDGCPWLIFHVHPLHGHPVCEKHWKEEGSDHGLEHPHHGLPIMTHHKPQLHVESVQEEKARS